MVAGCGRWRARAVIVVVAVVVALTGAPAPASAATAGAIDALPPQLTAVTPSPVPMYATKITLVGSSLAGVTQVRVDDIPRSFVVKSDAAIDVTVNAPAVGVHQAWVTSPDGAASIPFTVDGTPGAPSNVTATAGRQRAVVQFSAAAGNGNPITQYVVTSSPGGRQCWVNNMSNLSCTVHDLAAGTSYTFSVKAKNAVGTGPAATSNAVVPYAGVTFHPVTPTRILDTRTGNGGWGIGKLQAGTPGTLLIGGRTPVPNSLSGAVLNVTVTNGTDPSYLTVWPWGAIPQPATSNLNFGPGETTANQVIVSTASNSRIRIANAIGAVDVIVDVVGYFDLGDIAGDRYNAVTPTRLLDSRGPTGGWGAPLGTVVRDLTVRGVGPVPASATSVVANVTATNPSADTFLTAWPSGVVKPNASNINLGRGQTRANLVTVQIGGNGKVSFASAIGSVDVVVDVLGYYDGTTGQRFHPITPIRVLDNRDGTGVSGPWGPGAVRPVQVTGTGLLPADATSAVLNVTATNGTEGSFLSVYPHGVEKPTSSTVNFGPGDTIPNLTITGISSDGRVAIANHLGTVDVIADAVGYFATL